MSADASHQFKAPSDMPWIVGYNGVLHWQIGAVVVAGPALAYLLKDTVAIKKKIAAGHHGHDPHDAHADKHSSSEDHASPAVMKDDEGTEADVSSALSNATATDAPKAADASPAESSSDAAEPPKDEKEPEGTESK
ncbi:hypothetical protein B0H10DRAFT_2214844 [Mycena sp. CBHHK59/15]|nr:hypothetical protein B0H10DRAFT_2214844 [Mycena sp. CBHHK59/15]